MSEETYVKNLLETKEYYEYCIYGNKIKFFKGEMKYYKIRDYFDVITENAIAELDREFKKCGSMEILDKRILEIVEYIYEECIIPSALEILHNESLYGWDMDRLANCCNSFCDKFMNTLFDIYIDPYLYAICDKEVAIEARKERKDSRRRYVAHGYDIQSKVSSSMKAGMKNAATGLGHSMINAVGNTVTTIATEAKVLSIYTSQENKKKSYDACWELVNSIRLIIYEIINKEADYNIVVLTKEASSRAEATYNNIRNGIIKGEDAKKAIGQVLSDSPRFNEMYYYAVENFGDKDTSLNAMALDFKVDLRKHIDSLLDKKYGHVMKMRYDNENELFEVKEQILSSLEWYGLSENNKYIVYLDREWFELDKRLRTRDAIEFSTREEAATYSEDKDIFNTFISKKNIEELDLLDEGVVTNLRLEVASLDYKGDAFKLRLDEILPVVMKPHIEKQTLIKRLRETGDVVVEVRDIVTSSNWYTNVKDRVIFSIDSNHKLKDVLEYIKSDEKLIFVQDFSKINKTWKTAILFTDKKVILINSKRFIGVYYDKLKAIDYEDHVMMLTDNNDETMKSERWNGISLQDFNEWNALIENIISALQMAQETDKNLELKNFDVDRVKNRSDVLPVVSVVFGIIAILTGGGFYIPQILAIILGGMGNKKAKHSWIAKVGIGIGIIMLLFVLLADNGIDTTTESTTTETMSSENVISQDIIKLEEYINGDMTADEMGQALQNAGFNFVLDESGDYRTTDSSIWICNTDMGGCNVTIEPSLETKFSIYGLSCGMTWEEAKQLLQEYEAIEYTDEHDTKYKQYQLFNEYSVILTLDGEEIVGISFDYFWYE